MKTRLLTTIVLGTCLYALPLLAGDSTVYPPFVTDDYAISFGSQMEGIPGDPALFIPIKVSFSQPIVRIQLILSYDPTLLTPTLLAPNMFFQSFTYDISLPGRIRMSIVTDLPPPPDIPPIQGDTTVAWISCRIYSCDIGYDYLTNITYYEDPQTPHPDNFIVRDNNDIINPPALSLSPGDILIWHPDYGDININTYTFEIGDAVTFLNFFMGLTEFTRRQYANSDCNRDCFQATISDLVFLLRTITGDTGQAAPLAPEIASLPVGRGTPVDAKLLLNAESTCDVYVESYKPLGGATFVFELTGDLVSVSDIVLYPSAGDMQLFYHVEGNALRVTVLDWNGNAAPVVNGKFFSIIYSSGTDVSHDAIKIESASFSDNVGVALDLGCYIDCVGKGEAEHPGINSAYELSGFPNPFNSVAMISFSLPSAGNCELVAYDMLGRRVKTLQDGYRPAGVSSVSWDGTDDSNSSVASGIYFLRLDSVTGSRTLKMFLLK